MKTLVDRHLEDLILARLSVIGKKQPRPSEISKTLYPFVSLRLSQTEWRNRFASALSALREQGLVKADALLLTDAGCVRLQTALRLNVAPSAKTWQVFKRKYLPRLVLPKSSRVGSADPAMMLLAEQLRSPSELPKSRTKLVNAWLARAFGIRSNKMTLEGLRAALLARELGVPVRPRLDDVVRLGAAKLADAPKGTSEELVRAVTARWLSDAEPGSSVRAQTKAPSVPIENRRTEQGVGQALVQKVRAAARAPSARRFGPDKVFISSVWEALHSDPEISALGESGFKRALVDAHRDGALVLARADLIAAMDPSDVAASETRHLNATYHFIQT